MSYLIEKDTFYFEKDNRFMFSFDVDKEYCGVTLDIYVEVLNNKKENSSVCICSGDRTYCYNFFKNKIVAKKYELMFNESYKNLINNIVLPVELHCARCNSKRTCGFDNRLYGIIDELNEYLLKLKNELK